MELYDPRKLANPIAYYADKPRLLISFAKIEKNDKGYNLEKPLSPNEKWKIKKNYAVEFDIKAKAEKKRQKYRIPKIKPCQLERNSAVEERKLSAISTIRKRCFQPDEIEASGPAKKPKCDEKIKHPVCKNENRSWYSINCMRKHEDKTNSNEKKKYIHSSYVKFAKIAVSRNQMANKLTIKTHNAENPQKKCIEVPVKKDPVCKNDNRRWNTVNCIRKDEVKTNLNEKRKDTHSSFVKFAKIAESRNQMTNKLTIKTQHADNPQKKCIEVPVKKETTINKEAAASSVNTKNQHINMPARESVNPVHDEYYDTPRIVADYWEMKEREKLDPKISFKRNYSYFQHLKPETLQFWLKDFQQAYSQRCQW